MSYPPHCGFRKGSNKRFRKPFPSNSGKRLFFHLTQNVWRKIQELGLKKKYQQDPSFALQIRMIPALAFATSTDVPELFNKLFMELPTDAYDLALYFESTYIGRHISDTPIVIPRTFPMWNNHLMVHYGLPRTTNSVEAWHRSFALTSHVIIPQYGPS